MSKIFYMGNPPNRRSSPEYHSFVAVKELPSCETIVLAHPEEVDEIAETLNHFLDNGKLRII